MIENFCLQGGNCWSEWGFCNCVHWSNVNCHHHVAAILLWMLLFLSTIWRHKTVCLCFWCNAVVTYEIKLFQNDFSLRRRPSEIILFRRLETCLKLFQKITAAREYFPTCSISPKWFWNNFRTLLQWLKWFQFQTWLHRYGRKCKQIAF